jgi:Tfp pilus assembly protein PilW
VILRDLKNDESGTTLIELMVGLAAGLVVMAAIVIALVVTLRETGRVASHVEANQDARLAMTKVVNELHSACVAPQIAPVREGSSGNKLIFVHQASSQATALPVAPTPTKSELLISGTTLTQFEYPMVSGIAPNWKFAERPTSSEVLMTGIAQTSPSVPIFRYYSYSNGAVSAAPLPTALSETSARTAVQVTIAFNVAPGHRPAEDENAAAQIQNSVLLRLTSPSYNSAISDLPCQ